MPLRMWTYDLAREQSPTLDHMRALCKLTLDAGYDSIGLYLEHRFAYPSVPWSHGHGCLQPSDIDSLQNEFPELSIVPFINLLGHFEGFLYAEAGSKFAEERFKGMQACPCNPEFMALAERIVDDTIAVFNSTIIHIGGDETEQLGRCPACKAKVAEFERQGAKDGKAELYGRHFWPLAQRVLDQGRRPAVWGDMFLEHPTALAHIPKTTLVFNWNYFASAGETAGVFRDKGFDVVYCPAIHTYNATWLHLPQSERNIRENVVSADNDHAYGVCVTTWECGLFGNYETLFPVVRGAGAMLKDGARLAVEGMAIEKTDEYSMERFAPYFLKAFLKEGENYEEWARLMGVELQDAGPMFEFGGIRSGLKCRLLLYSNPFLAWLRHRDQLCGEPGRKALEIIERSIAFAPHSPARGVSEFAKSAIQFVQFAEEAHLAYTALRPGEATAALSPCRQIFDNLANIAKATHLRIGGSLADIERCRIAKDHVERVIRRIKEYGDGSLGYLPSFETITHPSFVPHDQASWWLINSWARE